MHWHAGRSLSEMAESLDVDRKTLRKYVTPAVAAGIDRPARPPRRNRRNVHDRMAETRREGWPARSRDSRSAPPVRRTISPRSRPGSSGQSFQPVWPRFPRSPDGLTRPAGRERNPVTNLAAPGPSGLGRCHLTAEGRQPAHRLRRPAVPRRFTGPPRYGDQHQHGNIVMARVDRPTAVTARTPAACHAAAANAMVRSPPGRRAADAPAAAPPRPASTTERKPPAHCQPGRKRATWDS